MVHFCTIQSDNDDGLAYFIVWSITNQYPKKYGSFYNFSEGIYRQGGGYTSNAISCSGWMKTANGRIYMPCEIRCGGINYVIRAIEITTGIRNNFNQSEFPIHAGLSECIVPIDQNKKPIF